MELDHERRITKLDTLMKLNVVLTALVVAGQYGRPFLAVFGVVVP